MVSMFGAEGDLWKWKAKKKKPPVVDFHLRLIVQHSSEEGVVTKLTLSPAAGSLEISCGNASGALL